MEMPYKDIDRTYITVSVTISKQIKRLFREPKIEWIRGYEKLCYCPANEIITLVLRENKIKPYQIVKVVIGPCSTGDTLRIIYKDLTLLQKAKQIIKKWWR